MRVRNKAIRGLKTLDKWNIRRKLKCGRKCNKRYSMKYDTLVCRARAGNNQGHRMGIKKQYKNQLKLEFYGIMESARLKLELRTFIIRMWD